MQSIRPLIIRSLGFSSVGVIGTTGHYLLLIVLVEALNVNPIVAATAGFIFGACINYALSYYFVFKSSQPHLQASVRFFVVAIVGAGLNGLLMDFSFQGLGLHYFTSQVIATVLVYILNLIVHQFWTFRA